MTQLDRLARWVLDGNTPGLRSWATDHLARRARQRVKKAPRKAQDRAVAATWAENWDRVRGMVMGRAEGGCELCGSHGFPTEIHHLAPGPLRRKYESPSTLVAACPGCHRAWHRGDVVTLQASLEAAERIGAPDIVQANLHRRMQRASK